MAWLPLHELCGSTAVEKPVAMGAILSEALVSDEGKPPPANGGGRAREWDNAAER
jgi:hypothetical protein